MPLPHIRFLADNQRIVSLICAYPDIRSSVLLGLKVVYRLCYRAMGVLKDGRSITGYRIRIINNDYKARKRLQSDQARIVEFHKSYSRRVDLATHNTLFLPSLGNWCKKYGTDPVIEKLESISAYVRKADGKKKINYMQTAVYSEFEKKEAEQ